MFHRLFRGDWALLSAAVLLSGVGVLVLFGLSGNILVSKLFSRQLMFVFVGIAFMLSFPMFDYRHLARIATPIYFLTIGVLIAVLFLGDAIRGTSGWIQVFGLQFQPVEFAKISLIIFLASFISKKQGELGDFVRLFASFILSTFLIFLVLRQPDLGSALVLASIWCGMIVISGIRKGYLVLLVAMFVGVSILGWLFLAPYQKDRILTFLHPDADPQGSGYNVLQSLVAVGSGGVFGKGLGHGPQSQENFLPERHTDFIFAVIAEELGLLGAFLVLVLFGILLWRVTSIASVAPDNFGYLMCMGFVIMISVQIVVNIGMNMGLLPVTGIPLPLVSYGGSSMISVFAGLSILQNIFSRRQAGASYEWMGGYRG